MCSTILLASTEEDDDHIYASDLQIGSHVVYHTVVEIVSPPGTPRSILTCAQIQQRYTPKSSPPQRTVQPQTKEPCSLVLANHCETPAEPAKSRRIDQALRPPSSRPVLAARFRFAGELLQDSVEVVKLATRALVYIHVPTKTPLFFDSDGRNNIFPTVYALWRVRELSLASSESEASSGADGGSAAAVGGGGGGGGLCCPPLVVHPPVSKFVLNGADVMLPGEEKWESEAHPGLRVRVSLGAARSGCTLSFASRAVLLAREKAWRRPGRPI